MLMCLLKELNTDFSGDIQRYYVVDVLVDEFSSIAAVKLLHQELLLILDFLVHVGQRVLVRCERIIVD